jgi:hypothetical protein
MALHTGQSYNLFVSSADRVSGTSADFVIEIPQLLGATFDSVVVRQVSIPKSFYLISPDSSFTVSQGLNSYQLGLDPGNYSLMCLLHCLRTKLATIGAYDGQVYTVGWPTSTQPQTGILTFSVTPTGTNPVLPVRFRFDTDGGIPAAMGFEVGDVCEFVGGVLCSTNCICLTSNPCLLLKSTLVSSEQQGQVLETVLCSDVPDFGFLQYLWAGDVLLAAKQVVVSNSNQHRFWVTTSTGGALDLHGLPVSFTLCFFNRSTLPELQHKSLILDHLSKLT